MPTALGAFAWLVHGVGRYPNRFQIQVPGLGPENASDKNNIDISMLIKQWSFGWSFDVRLWILADFVGRNANRAMAWTTWSRHG